MFTISRTFPCRRSVTNLLDTEITALVNAILAIKTSGDYNDFVTTHVDAMAHETPSGTATSIRNAAHRGPAFTPWHREFLIRYENALRSVDSTVSVPYWDWSVDEPLANPETAPVWHEDFLGGDGDPGDDDKVKNGPFREGQWEIVDTSGNDAGALRRQFARSADALATGWTTLPSATQVTTALNRAGSPYDASPWDVNSSSGFRSELEGWTHDGLHNRVHVWTGGSMLPGTSPNDPVFFLHHCFVDKLWADWQALHSSEPYVPASGGPVGHNETDAMFPWSTTPAQVIDHRDHYLFDTDPAIVTPDPETSLTFLDVPEGELTYRAVVIDVSTCSNLSFIVQSAPSAPFSVLESAVSVNPGRDAVEGQVRFWVGYTGTTDGDSAGDSVTIELTETGEQWVFPISANTVSRPTAAVVLALDQSGSMDLSSGVGTYSRIDVLRYSAAPFVELIQQGNGLAIISFDHDAYPVMGMTGPLPAPGPFDTDRATALGHITTHSTNPPGLTAIGDAVELASSILDSASGYEVKATVVFTDGHETASKRISEITSPLNGHIYAVGLGTAEQIQPTALTQLTNGTGGYMYLTGELNDDLYFRLSKYFLQILAGVTNEDIVVDPQGWLLPGNKLRVPFVISESDISTDVIVLSPAPFTFNFALETPDGDIIHPLNVASFPNAHHVVGQHSTFYRLTLPVPIGSAGAREGQWHALLEVDKDRFRKYLSALDNQPDEIDRVQAHGVRYSLNVHVYSNLKMTPQLTQTGQSPGADLLLNTSLTEYGLPMATNVGVKGIVTRPDGSQSTVPLVQTDTGRYFATIATTLAGVYTIRVMASGKTSRAREFTREQTLSGAVWQGGDIPPTNPTTDPTGNNGSDCLCRLLACLFSDDEFLRYMEQREFPVDAMRRCLKKLKADQKSGGSFTSNSLIDADINSLIKNLNEIIQKQ